MLNDTMPSVQHTHECTETCDFRKFAAWFKPRATALVEEHMALETPAFVRVENVDLYNVFVSNFATPELQQEHTCSACKQFLRGLGSFGVIKQLEFGLAVVPFALPYLDDAFEEEVPELYHKPYRSILNALTQNKHSILKASDIDVKSDYFGTEEAGGYAHMSLDYSVIKRTKINEYFMKTLPNPTGHGLGRAEIKSTQDWLDICYSAFEKATIPAAELLKRDRPILNEIATTLNQAKAYNRSLVVKIMLIQNGLRFLHLRKTTVGALIEAIAKGDSFEAAFKEYSKYTDPRNYMRPTRMPNEVEFEKSVAFLTENGYAEFMPMRLATWKDLEEHDMLNWSKAEPIVEVTDQPTDIFAKQRKRVTNPVATPPAQITTLPTQTCSLFWFINKILSKPENIVKVLFTPPKLHWGSFAISHKTERNNLFADGKMVRPFTGVQPINHYDLPRIVEMPHSEVDGIRIWEGVDEDDIGGVHFIFKDASWKIALTPPLFAETLVPELRPHRRTIEDWSRLNLMNVDENDKVIPFENAVLALPMGVGQSVTITFADNTKRRFDITSVQ